MTFTNLALDSYDAWFLDNLAINSQSLLFIFLPPLLFEMALAVDVRRLFEDLAVVMLMAVVAVIAATLFVGSALFAVSDLIADRLPSARCDHLHHRSGRRDHHLQEDWVRPSASW